MQHFFPTVGEFSVQVNSSLLFEKVLVMKMSKDLTEMVPVRWIRPGSRHHNVVHYVHRDLVHPTESSASSDRVTVFWPKRRK